MKEFFIFIFSHFWPWLGFSLLICNILSLITKLINRICRHANIRKHGYPPAHCDADGDFRPIKKEENDKV